MLKKENQKDYEIDFQRKIINDKDSYIFSLRKQVEDLSKKLEDKTIENQMLIWK